MPTPESFPIEKIFVPTKQKKAIKPGIVGEIAESMLDIGQQEPISVRLDGDRLVLVEGLHRPGGGRSTQAAAVRRTRSRGRAHQDGAIETAAPREGSRGGIGGWLEGRQ